MRPEQPPSRAMRRHQRRSYDERLAYLNGELPRWLDGPGGLFVLMLALALASVVMGLLLALVHAPGWLVGPVALAVLVTFIGVLLFRGAALSRWLQGRLMMRRRVGLGLLPTPDCPDHCECVEHLLARATNAEERARRAEAELARREQ